MSRTDHIRGIASELPKLNGGGAPARMKALNRAVQAFDSRTCLEIETWAHEDRGDSATPEAKIAQPGEELRRAAQLQAFGHGPGITNVAARDLGRRPGGKELQRDLLTGEEDWKTREEPGMHRQPGDTAVSLGVREQGGCHFLSPRRASEREERARAAGRGRRRTIKITKQQRRSPPSLKAK
ncbi:hypothetical protein NDU88_006968 [Pleurodeles waltl]|uniref:Uncharacterized protein n=1 Tax=Pleurodeles waltl TaxID=8319 RepID=A0AAV7MGJ3_PLEWA|nr:hypothetical protein NDU88_006968 [Pleurodeles waltl]